MTSKKIQYFLQNNIDQEIEFSDFNKWIKLLKKKVYYDSYGSIKDTYYDAKKLDKSIKYDDVRRWFEKKKSSKEDQSKRL